MSTASHPTRGPARVLAAALAVALTVAVASASEPQPDTGIASQSADGRRFPERLTLAERRTVLEYLESL